MPDETYCGDLAEHECGGVDVKRFAVDGEPAPGIGVVVVVPITDRERAKRWLKVSRVGQGSGVCGHGGNGSV